MMRELIAVLERSADQLDLVRYRTVLALLLLRSGETRFLPSATDEIHRAVDELADLELQRATLIAKLADELDVPDHGLTLSALVARADAPTAERLRDLQDRLHLCLADLREVTGSSTVLAASELASVRRSLGRWSGAPAAASGYGLAPPVPPARFDGSL